MSRDLHRRPTLLFLVTEDWYFCSHRLDLAKAAARSGYSVIVVTRVREHGARIEAEGLRLIPLEMRRRGLKPWTEVRVIWRLIRIYRQQRPDIVHHISIKPVLYGSLAARLARLPRMVNALTGLGYVFVSNDFLARSLRPLVRGAFRLLLNRDSSRVVLQNHDDVRLLTAAGALDEKHVVVIRGSGVDLERFAPRPEPEGPTIVLFASRMLWDKGLAEFVEAARTLREAYQEVRFVLVGDSDPENPASVPAVQIAHWCEEEAVEWWGRREDMPNVLAQAHVVCLPSYREGLPKVLLEAAAVGRALVATDVPGCREIVRDGENGLLVPVRDAKALARAFAELINKPKERRRMGLCSSEIARTEFSLERVVAATLAVYEGLLSE